MNFLAPALLWGLLTLIPLSAIYLLKVRPRRKPTNAYFLWVTILEEKTASALFRRLRDLWSWLLLIFATILIILALANPKLQTGDDRDIVIVIDHSPSMAANEGQQSTLDLAKNEAKSIVQALDESRRAAIAKLSDQLRFTSHLSDSPKDLLDAIEDIEQSVLATSPPAIEQANRLASRENARVLLITDGHAGFQSLSTQVEVLTLEGETHNVGLTSADLAWIPGQPNAASFFFRIASSFPEEKNAELILRSELDGSILRILPLNLLPGLNEAQTIAIEGITPGPWTATIELPDALASDNSVTFGLNEPRRISVKVDSAEPYFFQRSIEAFEQVGSLLRQVAVNEEITVSDKGDGDNNRLVLFHPSIAESPWWQELGDEIEIFAPEFLIEDHPILRHLELENLTFAGARQLTAPPNSVILVESQGKVPLIFKTSDSEGRQAIVFNLDPNADDFVLSPWFPVLIYESSRYLTGEHNQLNSVYALGTRVPFPSSEQIQTHWKKPSGKSVVQNEGLILQPGLHQISTQGKERIFGASLLDASESLLDSTGPQTSQKPLARGRLLSWWLLLLALVIVTVESILYHRRKLG